MDEFTKHIGTLIPNEYKGRPKATNKEVLQNFVNPETYKQAWEDTKEWQPWYDVGGNLGALGARGIEAAIPGRSIEEVGQQLVEMAAAGGPGGYLGKKIIGEIPVVKSGYKQLQKATEPIWKLLPEKLLNERRLATANAGFTPDNVFQSTTTRKEAGTILGGSTPQDSIAYQQRKTIRIKDDRTISFTSSHHRKQLVQTGHAIKTHPQGQQLLQDPDIKKLALGDKDANFQAVFDINTKPLRSSRVKQIRELYPDVPRKTIDDALGASDFKPPEPTKKELEQLEFLKSKTDITAKEFFDSLNRKGSYPTIDLINPDGTKIKWKAATFDEWNDRWKVINKHYGSNIDPKKFKTFKLDPEIATYGPDHKYIHEVLDKLPSHKKMNELMKSDKLKELPYKEYKKLFIKVAKDSDKVADNMAKWRYKKIAEYFKKFDPDSRSFNRIPLKEQKKFFQENASKLSSYGSRDLPSIEYLLSNQKLTLSEKSLFQIIKK